ncbi:MAG: chaperonin GroEL, partial [Acidobacteria bacterium]|nr:chaperonin GroEL [Acidobacteriota bacterium]
PGGGVALLRCVSEVEKMKLEGDEKIGADIVKKALEAPLRQIAENAGYEGSVVVEKVKEMDEEFGFNAEKEEYENMFQVGVVDPVKVVRNALINAASIASLLVTTEALVSEIPEKKEKEQMPGGPGGGGLY